MAAFWRSSLLAAFAARIFAFVSSVCFLPVFAKAILAACSVDLVIDFGFRIFSFACSVCVLPVFAILLVSMVSFVGFCPKWDFDSLSLVS